MNVYHMSLNTESNVIDFLGINHGSTKPCKLVKKYGGHMAVYIPAGKHFVLRGMQSYHPAELKVLKIEEETLRGENHYYIRAHEIMSVELTRGGPQ